MSEATWPNATTLVVAARTPGQHSWAAASAIALVRELASQQRKVVLTDLQLGGESLRDELGIPEGPGIVDVLFRGASFSAVAKRPEGESFFFLSTGSAAPPRQVLFQHPRWLKIASRLPGANAYLLPCVSSADWLNAGPIPGFESCIILNAAGLEVELPGGARRLAEFLAPPEIREEAEPAGLARVEPGVEPAAALEAMPGPEPAVGLPGAVPAAAEPTDRMAPGTPADAAAEPPDPGGAARAAAMPSRDILVAPGPPGRSRKGRAWKFVIGPLAAVVAMVVLVIALWSAKKEGLFVSERAPEEVDLPDVPPDAALEAAAETEMGGEVNASRSEPAVAETRSAEVELAYSVAIAAYSSFDDAVVRQEKWTRPELPFYIAPTVVRGVVYYRVLAGMMPDREEARELMRQLVREGMKDTVRDWDVKAARLAFSFGTYASAADAQAVIESLYGRGIHAYMVLSAAPGTGGGSAYHVYAGGYERPEDARPLRDQLGRAGLEGKLVERVGLVLR